MTAKTVALSLQQNKKHLMKLSEWPRATLRCGTAIAMTLVWLGE